jgi:hypothetical protein
MLAIDFPHKGVFIHVLCCQTDVLAHTTFLDTKDHTREAKLAGAVFIHTLVAAAGTFFFVALLYIWPEDLVDLLDPM